MFSSMHATFHDYSSNRCGDIGFELEEVVKNTTIAQTHVPKMTRYEQARMQNICDIVTHLGHYFRGGGSRRLKPLPPSEQPAPMH